MRLTWYMLSSPGGSRHSNSQHLSPTRKFLQNCNYTEQQINRINQESSAFYGPHFDDVNHDSGVIQTVNSEHWALFERLVRSCVYWNDLYSERYTTINWIVFTLSMKIQQQKTSTHFSAYIELFDKSNHTSYVLNKWPNKTSFDRVCPCQYAWPWPQVDRVGAKYISKQTKHQIFHFMSVFGSGWFDRFVDGIDFRCIHHETIEGVSLGIPSQRIHRKKSIANSDHCKRLRSRASRIKTVVVGDRLHMRWNTLKLTATAMTARTRSLYLFHRRNMPNANAFER